MSTEDVFAKSANAPAADAVAVVPSDSTVLRKTRSLWVGGAGDVAVQMASGNVATFAACAAGSTLPVQVQKVMATNTTATLILALY